ncbi:MAG: toxin-antitoxin system HicB family antitoxin [Longimicrobiales bacterium]
MLRHDRPSGRFVLRIDPGLHAALRGAARRAGVSLNDYCVRKLALPAIGAADPAAAVVTRAASLLGEDLAGLVVFGSWARDLLAEGSDVDVLVIVEPGIPIRRGLYRAWDADPLTWDSRPVEPHFVRLPGAGARVSALWAEVAIDGIVLLDPRLLVSRRLADIRRRIVAGEIVRRRAHGQPYWVEAA